MMKSLNGVKLNTASFYKWFLVSSWKVKGVLVALLLVLVWLLFFRSPAVKPQYQTATVDKGTLISTVTESGNVLGNQTNVTSPTNGVIDEIYVKNGDSVSADQALFKVTSTATPAEQAAAYASYQNALSSLTSTQDNQQTLDSQMWTAQKAYLDAQNTQNFKNNNITNPSTKQDYTDLEKQSIDSSVTQAQKAFTAAETKYKDGNVAVSAASAQVNSTWLAYQSTQSTQVLAPISGTIANFSSIIGSTASTATGGTSSTNGNSSSSSQPILVISNSGPLQVKALASEIDIPQIELGQKTTIILDAYPGKTFAGNVVSVDQIGTSNSGVVTYGVYVSFASTPPSLRSGMTATMTIQTKRKDNVLKVPTAAIQNSNGDTFVRVLKNGNIEQVSVETGMASDAETEIVSGLSEGETVVTAITTQSRTTGNQGSSPFSGLGGGRGFGGGGGGAILRGGR